MVDPRVSDGTLRTVGERYHHWTNIPNPTLSFALVQDDKEKCWSSPDPLTQPTRHQREPELSETEPNRRSNRENHPLNHSRKVGGN